MFFTPRDVPPPFRSQWISPYRGTARLWHVTNRIPARRAWSSNIWAIYSCSLGNHKVGHVTNMTTMTHRDWGFSSSDPFSENVPDRYSNSNSKEWRHKLYNLITNQKLGRCFWLVHQKCQFFTDFCWVSLVSSDFGKLWYHFTSRWFWLIPSLKLTLAPKNEWLEDKFPFWDRLFSGVTMLVSGRVGISIPTQIPCWRCEGDILVW